MTLAPPEKSGSSGASDAADLRDASVIRRGGTATAEPEVRPVVRQRFAKRKRQRQRAVIVQSVLTAGFVVLLAVLLTIGWNSAMRITGGRAIEVTDPAAPGFVAEVKPTSVTLVALTDSMVGGAVDGGPSDGQPVDGGTPETPEADSPADTPEADTPDADETAADTAAGDATAGDGAEEGGVTGGDAGGAGEGQALVAILLVIENGPGDVKVMPMSPRTTLWEFEDSPPEEAGSIFLSGGTDVLKLRLGADLTFGSTATLTVPASVLVALAEGAGPITIQNPDDVLQGFTAEDATIRYRSGELTLEPAEVAEFVSFAGYRESDAMRALRTGAVWGQLFDALRENGASAALAGIEAEDIDEFADVLDTISATDVVFDQVPLETMGLPVEPPTTLYRIDPVAMPDWVTQHVSYPVSAFPGQRAAVAVLNGTTNSDAPRNIAPQVVFAGGEVVLVGNADSFDVMTSSVEYGSPEAKAAADRIALELGVSATPADDIAISVDVVVTVGKDLSP